MSEPILPDTRVSDLTVEQFSSVLINAIVEARTTPSNAEKAECEKWAELLESVPVGAIISFKPTPKVQTLTQS